MQAKDFFDKLRRFDAYPKTLEDFRVKTYGGAAVTVISGILMVFLFMSEFNYYLTLEVHPELFVDTSRGQKLRINIDIVFPKMACGYLSLDAMDVAGESQIDIEANLFKQRLDINGVPINEAPEQHKLGEGNSDTALETVTQLDPNRCESCYGAETSDQKCCNTCDDVREAYRKKGWAFHDPNSIEQCKREGWSEKMDAQKNEGCKLFGYLEVNKVAGNFHIAPGKSFQQKHVHVHDMQSFSGQKFNITHKINHLSFGHDYPGIMNPLDNVFEKVDSTISSWNQGRLILDLKDSISRPSKEADLVIQWIRAHCGIPGNEKVDEFVKAGGSHPQPHQAHSFNEANNTSEVLQEK